MTIYHNETVKKKKCLLELILGILSVFGGVIFFLQHDFVIGGLFLVLAIILCSASLINYLSWQYWVINATGIFCKRKIGLVAHVKWSEILTIEERYFRDNTTIRMYAESSPTMSEVIGYAFLTKKTDHKDSNLTLYSYYNGVVHIIKNEQVDELLSQYYQGQIIDKKEESLKKIKS